MLRISSRLICAVILLVILPFIAAAQPQLIYGSKVIAFDEDESKALSPFYQGPILAFVDAGISGLLDPGDPIYLNVDPNDNQVSENDVRFTRFEDGGGTLIPGSQVKIGDPDHGYQLSRFGSGRFPSAELRYFDVNGDKAYGYEDPVYIDISLDGVSAGDIRVTSYLDYQPGSRVIDSDFDSDKPTRILPGMFNFYNVNGNINNGGWAIYDQGDIIYIDTQYPFYQISVNDVRL